MRHRASPIRRQMPTLRFSIGKRNRIFDQKLSILAGRRDETVLSPAVNVNVGQFILRYFQYQLERIVGITILDR